MKPRIESLAGGLISLLVLAGPLVYHGGLHDYANLPQSLFVQGLGLFLLLILSPGWFQGGQVRLILTPVTCFALAYGAWALASVFWAMNRGEALFQASHIWACIIIFYVISHVLDRDRQIIVILGGLMASAVLVSLMGCCQHLLGWDAIPQSVPPAATFANKNMAAQFVCLTLPAVPVLYLSVESRPLRFLVLVPFIPMSAFLVFALARTAWLAAGAALFVAMGFFFLSGGNRWRPAGKRMNPGILIGCFAILAAVAGAFAWSVQSGAASAYEKAFNRESLNLRFAIWRNTVEMTRAHPLTGVGLGNFKTFYPAFHRAAVADTEFTGKTRPENVHNDYIQAAAELGLPGLSLFAGLLGSGGMAAFRLAGAPGGGRGRFMAMAAAGSLGAVSVQALFSFPMERAFPPVILFIYLGILNYEMKKAGGAGSELVLPGFLGKAALPVLAGLGLGFIYAGKGVITGDRHYLAALAGEAAGQWETAASRGAEALAANPFHISAAAGLGRALMESGDHHGAVFQLNRVLESDPYNTCAMINLGKALFLAGDREKALNTFDRVLAVIPEETTAMVNKGKIYLGDKAYAKALDSFERAARAGGSAPGLFFNLGFLYMRSGMVEKAARAYETLLQKDPGKTIAHKYLAYIYTRLLSQPQKAKHHLSRLAAHGNQG